MLYQIVVQDADEVEVQYIGSGLPTTDMEAGSTRPDAFGNEGGAAERLGVDGGVLGDG